MTTDNQKIRKALIELLGWATSGARYKNQNPYTIPVIKNAMKVLTEIDGGKDYLDLPLPTSRYNEYPSYNPNQSSLKDSP